MPRCLADEPFDEVPPQGVARIAKRESPDTVQMIREKDKSVKRKRVLRVDLRESTLQGRVKRGIGQHLHSLEGGDRKEVGSTGHDRTTEGCHWFILDVSCAECRAHSARYTRGHAHSARYKDWLRSSSERSC